MSASPSAEALAAEAARLIEAGAGALPAPGFDLLALAWALKADCYAHWNREPGRAAKAAQALAQLPVAALPEPERLQVAGLAAWTAGMGHVAAGDMAAAVQAFDRAAEQLRQAGQPDPAAQTQVPKVMALSMLGRHEDATACAIAAHDELLRLGNLAAASRVSNNLGISLQRRGDYVAAAQHCRQASVLFARQGDHLNSVLADINLANALASMGDVEEAERIYARVRMRAANQALEYPLAVVEEWVALLDLSRGRYGPALAGMESARRRYEALALPHALAIAEKQLADTYLDLRLLPEALALFDTSIAQLERLGMPEEQAWGLAQRGRTLALLGRVPAAREAFEAAAALFAAAQHAVGLASVRQALAELALAQGDGATAGQQAQDALAGFAEARHAEGEARAQALLAEALWQQGDAPGAQAAFARTLALARERQLLQVQVRCLTGQALAAPPDEAAALLEAAIELLEDQRRALPGDEFRRAFLTEHLRPYQQRLRLALAGGDAAEVLVQLERYRARSLDERIATAKDLEDTDAIEDDAPLRERLNWLYRRLQRLQDEGEHAPALHEEMLRTEHALLERTRRRRMAQPRREEAASTALDASALQAALGPTDALVAYGVLDDELFALVASRQGLQLLRHCASWAQVQQAVQSTRFQIETLSHGLAAVQPHLAAIHRRTLARLEQLHALLWAPVQAALPDTADVATPRRLLLVLPGLLNAIPFAALQGPDGLALGARFELAQLHSARAALRGLAHQMPPPQALLALGESTRLPHAAAEARRVADSFPQAELRVGEAATLAALQAAAGSADLIHLACHAQFRTDNPRFSALHLVDGALTVDQAETLRLRPGMVVLSACESGLADAAAGDERIGLVRAFLVAGAARVLASLWPVDDAVTADFMRDFYGALVAGQGPAQALKSAQQRLRQQRPEPYFWAAFTLYGGW